MKGLEQVVWLYDGMMALADRGRLGRWREWLARGATGRVLEVGCGTGRNLPRYSSAAVVVGCDPYREPLVAARRRAPGIALVQARAEALPFRGGAFDTVVSALVFCSVDEPSTGLGEVRRVLAPGGSLRMIEHVRARRAWAARMQDLVQPAWTLLSGGCRPNRDTEKAVVTAGFVVEESTRRASGLLRRFVAR